MNASYLQIGLHLWLMTAAACAAGGPPGSPDPQSRPSHAVLDKYLGALEGAELGSLREVTSDPLRTVFPSARFFGLAFRRYPSEVVPTPPLKANNLFVVEGDKVVHITSEGDLAKYFVQRFPANAGSSLAKEGVDGWLFLAEVLCQDGHYEFSAPVSKADATEAHGTLTVKPRTGKGEIHVTFRFKDGRLVEVTHGGELTPGRRNR